MRILLIGLFLGAFGGLNAQAQTADSRTVAMPFAECLAIVAETAEEVGEDPIKLVNDGDLTTFRINASDGYVTVSCNRAENRMSLSKSPVPRAAGITASR